MCELRRSAAHRNTFSETAMKKDSHAEQPAAESLVRLAGAQCAGQGNGLCAHLIRIADQKARERALSAFRGVREARLRFPGHVMGVTDEHLRILKMEKIPFEYLSKAPHGKEEDAPRQP